MKSVRSLRIALAAATVLALTGPIVLDAVNVRVEHEKTFDFSSKRTWGWSPGNGKVMMVRTKDDDSDAMKARVDPIMRDAMRVEMMKRGLTEATANPDLTVTYYLLLTVNVDNQTLGEFLPATVMWSIPPFAPQTQSFKVMNRGSLVVDMSAGDTIVWRGLAQAEVAPDAESKKRETRLREAVRDLLKKYPPKAK